MTRLGAPDLSPTPLIEDLPPRVGKESINKGYTCSLCGGKGHSARSKTCGLTREQRNERTAQRKRDVAAGKRKP